MILKSLILTVLVTDGFGLFFFDDCTCKKDCCKSTTFECPKDITDLAERSASRAACKQATDPVCEDKYSGFRDYDGACNHKDGRGAAMDTLDRVIENNYEDGFGAAQVQNTDGSLRPNVPDIVKEAFTDKDVPIDFTLALAEFGQFAAHDTLSTQTVSGINCCKGDGDCPPIERNPFCFPIAKHNVATIKTECINFVRSQRANCTNACEVGFINNINEVTAFLDLSLVYGSNKETAAALRTGENGTLKTEKTPTGEVLPNSCPDKGYCPLTGDDRANQHAILTAFHLVFVLCHNGIARNLREVNPNATDEQTFQQSRKILIGWYQHIIYNHYLIHLLGKTTLERWKLDSMTGRTKYNCKLDPRTSQEFGGVANRHGHSQFPGKILMDEEVVPLRFLFGRGELTITNFIGLLRAIIGYSKNNTKMGAQAVDLHVTKELTEGLFFNNATGKGGNLIQTNVQRLRDHGIPSYLTFRRFCCQPNVTGFDDPDLFGENAKKLKEIYKRLEFVEAYPGVLAERVKNGLVSETAACIIANQYYKWKYADRFFFDTTDRKLGWPRDDQLDEIRKANLSMIFCYSGLLDKIQIDMFQFASETNPYVECADVIKSFDFSKFASF